MNDQELMENTSHPNKQTPFLSLCGAAVHHKINPNCEVSCVFVQYKSNVPHPTDAGWGTTLGVQGKGKRNSRFRIMPMFQHLERERGHHRGSRGNGHFRAGGKQPASGVPQLIFVETAGTVPWRMIWCISSIWLPTIGFLKAKMIIFIAYTYLTQHLVVKNISTFM